MRLSYYEHFTREEMEAVSGTFSIQLEFTPGSLTQNDYG